MRRTLLQRSAFAGAAAAMDRSPNTEVETRNAGALGFT